MENKLANSDGVEIQKKKRTLDLKSIYEVEELEEVNEVSEVGKRKNREGDDNVGGERKKRKRKKKVVSVKDVGVSSVEEIGKRSEKSLDEVYSDEVSLRSNGKEKAQGGVSEKLESSRSNGSVRKSDNISLSMHGDVIRIPKRKRDSVRRRQPEFDTNQKVYGRKLNADSRRAIDQRPESASDLCTGINKNAVLDSTGEFPKVPQEEGLEHHKENNTRGSRKPVKVQKIKLEISDSGGDNCGPSSKNKLKKRTRKRKNEVQLASSTVKEGALPSGKPIEDSVDLLENEEENLEENAARMLSSRFNPDLNLFSGDRKDSSKDLSVEKSTEAGFIAHGQSEGDESDSAMDDNGIVLRPRRDHKVRSLSRKRRHFYEVMFEDLDPCWVLQKKIKIFWPLDKSWYIGVVMDYDPKGKLHHVKYEDREEEWINLGSERFKLLLFPSEIPYKAEKTRSTIRNIPSGRKKPRDDDEKPGRRGSFKDSEPIISWLSRTNRRVKTTSSGPIKKPKSQIIVQAGSDDITSSVDSEVRVPGDDGTYSLTGMHLSAVYYRRRVRQSSQGKILNPEDNCKFRHEPVTVAYFDRIIKNSLKRGEIDEYLGQPEYEMPALIVDIDELLRPFAITDLGDQRFAIRLPGFQVLKRLPVFANCWWLHRFVLLHCGSVISLWPKVKLEILLVDNSAGIKLFLFEDYMTRHVSSIFLIFSMFRRHFESGEHSEMQLPVTSVRVKFSCARYRKRSFYSYYFHSKLRDSEWSFMDFELKRKCLLMKQLGLPECTYDNINALQSELDSKPYMYNPEVEQKSEQHSSFGLSPLSLLSRHLEKLIGPRVLQISAPVSDPVPISEPTEVSGSCNGVSIQAPCNGSYEKSSDNGSQALKKSTISDHCGSRQKNGVNSMEVCNNSIDVCNDVNRKRILKKRPRKDWSNGSQPVALPNLRSRKAVQINEQSCNVNDFDRSAPKVLALKGPLSQGKSSLKKQPRANGIVANTAESDRPKENVVEKGRTFDLAGQLKQGVISRTNPTAPRSAGHRNKNTSPSFGLFTRAWGDGKAECDSNGCKIGVKKPPMQISCPLPSEDIESSPKLINLQPKENLSHRKIKKPQENKTVEAPRSPPRNLDLVSCDGNILIILEDRGWRELEAQVTLEPADHNEWRLSVKVAGTVKYKYKASQLLQLGASNRYTHAMMWKAEKDWMFEFPDRNQWVLFKEMHNECYNRNLRAASVKNIPIPGVRLIEDFDDNGFDDAPFCCNPSYYMQEESDVEMALNPSRVLYDMDSEDEQWLSRNEGSSEDNDSEGFVVSDEFFEKMMDMLEKAAYVRQHDQFSYQEIEEIFPGVGPVNTIRKIHDYWSQKRRRAGMPLVRQLQPPLWERYQKQLREWELSVSRRNNPLLSGGNDKPPLREKVPMSAFCLKPRGLEVPHRGSKQRSHKKYHGPGHNSAVMGDHDGYHANGRRYNRFGYVDEKVTSPGSYDSSDFSPRVFLPRAASMAYLSMSNGFDRNHHPRPYRIKSKKIGSFIGPSQPHCMTPCSPNAIKLDAHQRKAGYPELPYQKMIYLQPQAPPRRPDLDGPDLEEFRLRDASGAAQHARVMANLKRQKAERLHCRADLAMQKAMIALMTAKAMKESPSEPSTSS